MICMGNSDGLLECLIAEGTNKVISFEGGYFSFAHGDEIALVLDDVEGFFILNCGEELFKEVLNKVEETKDKTDLIKFWLSKESLFEKSDWSNDWNILKKVLA